MGTIELLLTLPLGERAIVGGKLLAAIVILMAMLVGSAAAVVPLCLYGQPDLGPIVGGYIGVFLLGLAFLSIGIFVSSLSSNQIVAAVVTWGILTLLWFIDYAAALFNDLILVRLLRHLSFSVHYLNLIRGVIDGTAIAYFVGLFCLMAVATCQALVSRRFK
jgi:ABC-2 type transport system permease protein